MALKQKRAGDGRIGNEPATEDPSVDELYDVFANRRRRFALHYLKWEEGPVDIGDLAEQVAAWENEKPRREVTSAERKYAYSALQQRHLPKMHELGLVEFDKREGAVEPTTTLNEVDVYAEVVEEGNVPWGVYFAGLSTIHLAVLVLVVFDVAPLTVLSDLEWSLLFLSSFFVSSLVFMYDTRRMKLDGSGAPPEVERG